MPECFKISLTPKIHCLFVLSGWVNITGENDTFTIIPQGEDCAHMCGSDVQNRDGLQVTEGHKAWN